MKGERNFDEWDDSSPSTAQLGRPSYLAYGSYSGLSYGSPVGLVRGDTKNTSHEASYYLKSPPSITNQKNLSEIILNRTKVTFISISWWIYLITCYSLLLDTCILQSRGIMHIRHFFRKYANKKSGIYLLFFILLPMCLATGGYGYLALHGTNSTFSLTYPSFATFPNHEAVDILPPKVIPPSTEQNEQKILAEYTNITELENNLKAVYEEIGNLREKLIGYDGKIAESLAEYDSKIQSISTMPSESTLKSLLSDVSGNLRIRIEELSAQYTEDKSQDSEKISSLNVLLQTAMRELQNLQNWRLETDRKLVLLTETMNTYQNQKHDMLKELLPLMIPHIEQKMISLTAQAKQAVFNDIRTQVTAEVIEKAKLEILPNHGIDLIEVKRMIDSAIKLYDSDKTGLADYALESSGGIVLNTRCTENFNGNRPQISIWKLKLWSEPNNPRVVIQPGIAPGHCWSFKGFDGYLVIQLSRRIIPTSFSLEHIPVSLAPDGNIASAPKKFSVYGLLNESDFDGVKLGEYHYNDSGLPLQTFSVQHENPKPVSIVELRIHSNHGNPDYTCLYRFRVHGRIG